MKNLKECSQCRLWLQLLDSNQRPQGYEPCELPTALSCQRGLPELRTPAGEIKNECVEQKKGDNKWKAEGGGKGVRMWNTPESHNLVRLLSCYHYNT